MLHFNTDTIVSILLTNGVEIVAKFQSKDNNTVEITNPLRVYLDGETINVGVFMFGLEPGKPCKLNVDNIISVVKTQPLLAKDYEQLTQVKQ